MSFDWVRCEQFPFVKICGITNVEDATECWNQGVAAIGILLEKPGRSPRLGSARLQLEQAAEITRSMKGKCKVFILIHTDCPDLLDLYAKLISPDVIQICLKIPPWTLIDFRNKWPDIDIVHSLRVSPEVTVAELEWEISNLASESILDGIVLDSAKGGSGQTHDWDVSAQITELFAEFPILLAGGLNKDNIVSAMSTVKCAGIDLMTSVNSHDGPRKDKEKIARLMSTITEGNL